MERDDEVKDKRTPPYGNRSGSGKGNSYTTHYRSYAPRTTRWWSLDSKPTASESWYVGLGNNPILNTDVLGDSAFIDGYQPWDLLYSIRKKKHILFLSKFRTHYTIKK